MPSLQNIQKQLYIATGYIRLHVSAVTRPSSDQQGVVLIKVHSLAFFQWDQIVYIKKSEWMYLN